MTEELAVIEASYSDFKLIKTRSSAQIILEIPIEEAERALKIFGVPMPGAEIRVAVARIVEPAQNTVPESGSPSEATAVDMPQANRDRAVDPMRSERSKQAYAQSSPAMKAVVRAAILCEDPLFQTWMDADDSDQAAVEVRKYCHVDSRADISKDERALRLFLELEDRFQRSRPMLEVVAR